MACRAGLLHPGEMGSVAALTLQNAGREVYWVSEGRRPQSHRRAAELGLKDAGTLNRLCELCPVIVSVCPPEFAEEVAGRVAEHGFRGLYIDCNAVSPERVQRMAKRFPEGRFVDASIIGLATREPGKVWIYFSGQHAEEAAVCFGSAGPLQAEVIGGPVGRASALKMCFAGYNKGAAALLTAVLAAAERLGVREALERQWSRTDRELAGAGKKIARVTPKAWRFAPEMREIAETLESAGVTPDFHCAAAALYRRLAEFKDVDAPELEKILAAL